jgi:hypothetical protein
MVIAFTLVAVRAERHEQLRRDAKHWYGVVVQLATSGLTTINVIFSVLQFVYFR